MLGQSQDVAWDLPEPVRRAEADKRYHPLMMQLYMAHMLTDGRIVGRGRSIGTLLVQSPHLYPAERARARGQV